MKVRLIFGRTGYDYEVSWADIKTIIVDIPEELKDYNLMGGEKLEGVSQMIDKKVVYEEADAKLMAAAPELYDALEQVVENYSKGLGLAVSISRFKRILAKARGESDA